MPRLSRADAQLLVHTLAELLKKDKGLPHAPALSALVQRLSRRLDQAEEDCAAAIRNTRKTTTCPQRKF
jgi:hypothetical protein